MLLSREHCCHGFAILGDPVRSLGSTLATPEVGNALHHVIWCNVLAERAAELGRGGEVGTASNDQRMAMPDVIRLSFIVADGELRNQFGREFALYDRV